MPIFLFLDDNLSKCQGILTKLCTCTDIKRSNLRLLMGKFSQFSTVIYPQHNNGQVLLFYIFITISLNNVTVDLRYHQCNTYTTSYKMVSNNSTMLKMPFKNSLVIF